MISFLAHLFVISVFIYTPVICTDISVEELSQNALQSVNHENVSEDLIDQSFRSQEDCNYNKPCQNGGTCYGGWCRCPRDYTGDLCETPKWCDSGRCGYGNDVECLWNSLQQKGECRCKKENYFYIPKDRQCRECDCGDHGTCQVVDDTLECKCDDGYAVKSSKCEYCYCGPESTKCSYNSRGEKICQCQKDYASKTADWSSYGTWCEICVCGEHGRCRWEGDAKICDCDSESRYSSFEGKCRECDCGPYGICEFNESGEKNCSCDYGYAEKDGYCKMCDCNAGTRRSAGIGCKFEYGVKQCTCPNGFKKTLDYCRDIDECYEFSPCPSNTECINKLGTFDCRCKEGFEPIDSSLDPKLSGCKDIDECYYFPCKSSLTRCVNTPGSYDCVCKEDFYLTSSTYGNTYRPDYNTCYEIETQWREAAIAMGVIFSVIAIGMSIYIRKHQRRS